LSDSGIPSAVVRVTSVKPLDSVTLKRLSDSGMILVTVEENQRAGGLGGAIAEWCQERVVPAPLLRMGVDDCFPEGYSLDTLRRGLTGADIAEAVRKTLKKRRQRQL
jgi:1-deoxy-D-xylulose-5-phosphate synthase